MKVWLNWSKFRTLETLEKGDKFVLENILFVGRPRWTTSESEKIFKNAEELPRK
jgi:hypothetical protein